MRHVLIRRCLFHSGGQTAIETAFLLPMLIVLLGGVFELGRLMYIYNTLEKSMKSGVQYLQRTQGVDFCNPSDPAFTDAANFIVYGNLQGTGDAVLPGLTPSMVFFYGERGDPNTSLIVTCPCAGTGSCDTQNGGTPPDYIVANLGAGYQLDMTFPMGVFGLVNLAVSVRLPFLGA
jgi:hypothetical protein